MTEEGHVNTTHESLGEKIISAAVGTLVVSMMLLVWPSLAFLIVEEFLFWKSFVASGVFPQVIPANGLEAGLYAAAVVFLGARLSVFEEPPCPWVIKLRGVLGLLLLLKSIEFGIHLLTHHT